jgi:hypothetical protein
VLSGIREKSGLTAANAAATAMQPGGRHTEGGVMNYYDVTKKVQEQKDADFLKAMKKNKQFWADPMSYPVRIEK